MKAMVRGVMVVMLSALAQPAFAANAASNGTGDGEANIPFASFQQDEPGPEEVGAGSGEPGRTESARDAAARAEAQAQFEQQVWTAP